MDKKQTEKYIKEYITRLKPDLSSYKIILYGSFLKDSFKPGESDIDMLVISKDFNKMNEDERFDFLYKNTLGLPLDWHIYGFTPDEIKNVSPLNTLSEILRTGKQL
ncbi:MAG: nucleotidyltransferase domain-containing protein [bacterium]|nr:nucleotidyltransferase domain-containing protein [bacterium]